MADLGLGKCRLCPGPAIVGLSGVWLCLDCFCRRLAEFRGRMARLFDLLRSTAS